MDFHKPKVVDQPLYEPVLQSYRCDETAHLRLLLEGAEMPAAAPQPSRVPVCSGPTLSMRAMFEPMAEPICTIGPSAPAEPPDPRPPCPCCGGTMVIIETIERRYLPRGPPSGVSASGNPAS